MSYWNKDGLLSSMDDLGELNEELVIALRDFKQEDISKTKGLDLNVHEIIKVFTQQVINEKR